ncbi:MAG: hypothetical protein N2C14_06985, partial [Planctomycetales bacterium]
IMAQRFERKKELIASEALKTAGVDISETVERPESEHELPWEPYAHAEFQQHLKEGKTVMVDFTADW